MKVTIQITFMGVLRRRSAS